jgi:hypothetical protein
MGTGYSPDPASRAYRFLTCLRQREGMVYPWVGVFVLWGSLKKRARSVGTLPFWEAACTYLGIGTVGPQHH